MASAPRSALAIWVLVGALAVVGLGALGVGLYLALGEDEGREGTQRDRRADGRRPQQPGPREGLLRFAPPGADLIARLHPRRMFEIPGFRAGWQAHLPSTAKLMLSHTGTRPELIDEMLIVAPKIPPEAWQGGGNEVPSAVAIAGVDPARLTGLLAEQGWAHATSGEVELWQRGEVAAAKVGDRSVLAGQLPAVKAALAARALAGANRAEAAAVDRILASVAGQVPLFAGLLRLAPGRRAAAAARLELDATDIVCLAAGAERQDGVWILRGALRTTAGSADKARGALVALRDKLARSEPATSVPALRSALAAIAIATVGDDLATVSLRLTHAELERLVLAAQRRAGGHAGDLLGERPSR